MTSSTVGHAPHLNLKPTNTTMTYNAIAAALRETLTGILTSARDAARESSEPTPAYTVTETETLEIGGIDHLVGLDLGGCDENIADWDDDAIARCVENEMDRWGSDFAARLAND